MQDVYKNIEQCNPGKKRKVLIAFDDTIVEILNDEKINSIIIDLCIRCRKQKISLFITQSYFQVPQDVSLNTVFFYHENPKQTRT